MLCIVWQTAITRKSVANFYFLLSLCICSFADLCGATYLYKDEVQCQVPDQLVFEVAAWQGWVTGVSCVINCIIRHPGCSNQHINKLRPADAEK